MPLNWIFIGYLCVWGWITPLSLSATGKKKKKTAWNFPTNNCLTSSFEYCKDVSSFRGPLFAREPVMTEGRRIRIRGEACQRDAFQVIRPLIILLSLSIFFFVVGFVGALALPLSSQLMNVCGEQAEAGDKRVYLSSRPFNVAAAGMFWSQELAGASAAMWTELNVLFTPMTDIHSVFSSHTHTHTRLRLR